MLNLEFMLIRKAGNVAYLILGCGECCVTSCFAGRIFFLKAVRDVWSNVMHTNSDGRLVLMLRVLVSAKPIRCINGGYTEGRKVVLPRNSRDRAFYHIVFDVAVDQSTWSTKTTI
jgi:hypothetical protein